jgi:hypothetical protein
MRILIFVALFVVGVLVGWMLRGVDLGPLEEAGASAELVPDESEKPDFRELYSNGHLDEIVRVSQGRTDVIQPLLQNSTSRKARMLLEKFIAVQGPYFDGLMSLDNLKKQGGEFESALVLL